MKQTIYQIVSITGGSFLAGRKASNDKAAKAWLNDLLNRGVISGVPVMLQRYEGQQPTPPKGHVRLVVC